MNRYQLAKIVDWAGTLDTRKRMQKVVYLLQVAGCPLGADYTLHHYGPYSHDVARLTDEMVQASLLAEKASSNAVGQQYSYSLSDERSQQPCRIRGPPVDGLRRSRWPIPADSRGFSGGPQRTRSTPRRSSSSASRATIGPSAIEKMCQFKDLTNGQSGRGASRRVGSASRRLTGGGHVLEDHP